MCNCQIATGVAGARRAARSRPCAAADSSRPLPHNRGSLEAPLPHSRGSLEAPLPHSRSSLEAALPRSRGSLKAPLPHSRGSLKAPLPHSRGSREAALPHGRGSSISRRKAQKKTPDWLCGKPGALSKREALVDSTHTSHKIAGGHRHLAPGARCWRFLLFQDGSLRRRASTITHHSTLKLISPIGSRNRKLPISLLFTASGPGRGGEASVT